jgi:rod shape determining protein RodA
MLATFPNALRRFRLEIPALAAAVVALGIVFIASASLGKPFAATQAKWLAISLCGFAVALSVPYPRIERATWALYAVSLALLLGVHVFGKLANGARSWYQLGPAKLQPSEMAKIVVICAVAKVLMYRRDIGSWRAWATVGLVAGPPILSILKEPDHGTVMVFAPTILVMLFVAGAPLKQFVAAGGIGAAGAVALYRWVLSAYQRHRIDVFLDPALDPKVTGYHTLQARIAIGSGGFGGQGWGEGSQTQLHALPEAHTDFIFAVIGEEGGFLAAAGLLLLLLGLVLVCLDVAARTREPFGRLVCVGVAALFTGQIIVNCGMTMGLMPVTGITLPFVSYGGSSLLTCFTALGLVANVAMRPVASLGRDFRPGAV